MKASITSSVVLTTWAWGRLGCQTYQAPRASFLGPPGYSCHIGRHQVTWNKPVNGPMSFLHHFLYPQVTTSWYRHLLCRARPETWAFMGTCCKMSGT